MHVLALDTTTREGSVALVERYRIVTERRGDGAHSHAERLPAELLTLAEASGLSLKEIDLFAVASGPGSFTGLRIGIATIQGLALTLGRRIVAVSALEALAERVSANEPAGTLVAAWIDARRHTVFSGLYRIADAPPFSRERLVEVDPPTVADPATVLTHYAETIVDRRVMFTGDGAALYAALIASAAVTGSGVVETPLLAGTIGQMAVARAARGEAIDPAAVRPLYIRRPDAETARDHQSRTSEIGS